MPAPGTDQWATIRHQLAKYRAEGKGDPRLLAQPTHKDNKDNKEATPKKTTKEDEEDEEEKSNSSR
jgi:hypothetical protein